MINVLPEPTFRLHALYIERGARVLIAFWMAMRDILMAFYSIFRGLEAREDVAHASDI